MYQGALLRGAGIELGAYTDEVVASLGQLKLQDGTLAYLR